MQIYIVFILAITSYPTLDILYIYINSNQSFLSQCSDLTVPWEKSSSFQHQESNFICSELYNNT